MGYFILRKNLNETVNNYLTLINNSVSQQVYEYSPQSGEKKANGFIYRPALRMQFVPYLRLGSSNENHYFYPSKLKIMKKEDYWVDFDYRKPNQNGKIKFRKFTKNNSDGYDIEEPQLYNGYQLSKDIVVGTIFDLDKTNETLEDSRKNKYNTQFPQSGVIFQQVIPYQKLRSVYVARATDWIIIFPVYTYTSVLPVDGVSLSTYVYELSEFSYSV